MSLTKIIKLMEEEIKRKQFEERHIEESNKETIKDDRSRWNTDTGDESFKQNKY